VEREVGMSQSDLSKKLAMRPGAQVLRLVNAPAGFVQLLGELPEGVTLSTEAQGKADGVLLFMHNSAELHALSSAALAGVRRDGLIWLVFPKKSAKTTSDLSRDVVWELMKGSGLRPVTNISIDEVWSALRFRPEDQVKSKG
jgi:hypothetical protein